MTTEPQGLPALRAQLDRIDDELLDKPLLDAAPATSMFAPANPQAWRRDSWRNHPAEQLPEYPDEAALARVEQVLAAAGPVVAIEEISALREQLALVARGDAFLVQGGDCAESFGEFSAGKVRADSHLLLRIGSMLRAAGGPEVVHVARIGGQFAKPRSAATETIGGLTLPSFRGDAVNCADFTEAARIPNPGRLLQAHQQAQVTARLLHCYAAAPNAPVFTSHEALLLNYEEALTRFDPRSGRWWATSGHMIWIGDRTRRLDGAHVEFARGVANPVGLKCGPSLGADELLRLVDWLDPRNEPGRLTLIARFGAARVGQHLPPLMRATRRAGRNVTWSIDPMHGNTQIVEGLKTRVVQDVVEEIKGFFDVAAAEGVHPGGVHLEMTGSDVTECIGGTPKLLRKDLERSYLTQCDPRLNEGQSLDVARVLAALVGGLAERAEAA